MPFDVFASVKRHIARWQPSRVTRANVRLAYAAAVTVDLAQFLLGPFGWTGFDEILDAVGMIVISRLIGFHPLLLPTFILEFVPLTDMLPTWTGCTALVVRSRKNHGLIADDDGPAIDIKAEKVE